MQSLQQNAYAKVNLALDILGKRPDGYHDLRMVMQTISLCDAVTVRTETGGDGIAVSTDCVQLPGGPDNLAWKAADAFYRATGIPNRGTEIVLQKRIPMQAGMAGGSTDAAAVLRTLRTLTAPELPWETLETIGEQVGSDVPFCVRGGTSLVEGRGERLTPLTPLPDCAMLVCKPPFGLSTPALFGRVRVDDLQNRPDFRVLQAALSEGRTADVAQAMGNVFQQVLLPDEQREITNIIQTMRTCGAWNAVMTGSGPTVFGIFPDDDTRCQAETVLRRSYEQVFAVSPVPAV